MSLPIPSPLFDTLEHMMQPPAAVCHYLDSLSIPGVLQEFELTRQFLLSYAGSLDTFTAYRREVERLLHWSWSVAQKPIKELTRNDIRDYIEFSASPPLEWIGTKTVARFVTDAEGNKQPNKEWRPYVVRVAKAQRLYGRMPDKKDYQLTNRSMEALFAGISTYLTFLQQEEYIVTNPVKLVRQKSRYLQKQQQQRVTRKLSETQWEMVIHTALKMADENAEDERILFMMSAFYLLGLRISELAETPGRCPKMGDFAPDKQGLWWFTTVGKGNKLRDVAVPDALLSALRRYRMSQNLSPLPGREESTPLLNKQRGVGGLGTRQVRNLVQSCFDRAIGALRDANQQDEADDLTTATVHWLRHTAISADVLERPREHVRDDAGHENTSITDRYIDIDREARHASAKHKQLIKEKIND